MKKLKLFAIALLTAALAIAPAAHALSDIGNYQFQISINALLGYDIVQGYPNGTFQPDRPINRAEFTKIVIGALYDPELLDLVDTDCFPDVPQDSWYATYVCLAWGEGIIDGYPNGEFRADQLINQAEALKIIYESFYGGVEDVEGEWYEKYLFAAEYDGMLYFEPENAGAHQLTRGEMSYFIAWLLDEDGSNSDQIDFEQFYGEGFFDDLDFGWPAMSADECYEDEYFDAEDMACYLNPDSDYFDTLETQQDFLEGEDSDSFEGHGGDFDSETGAQVVYSVSGDTITLQSDQSEPGSPLADTSMHNKLWDKFTTLIPAQNRSQFSEYVIFYEENSDFAAYVQQTDDTLTTWTLGINAGGILDSDNNFTDEADFEHTLIHEYAHVMTLNDSQVNPNIADESCAPQFFTGEGCARENSFINLFFKNFWTRAMLDTVRSNPESGGFEVYDESPSSFVTEYAATNPGEDIAESFTFFVLKPKPADCSVAAPVADQKVCLFYDYQSLLTLRKNIRDQLN